MSAIIDDPVRGLIGLGQYDKNTAAITEVGEEFAQVFLRVWCYTVITNYLSARTYIHMHSRFLHNTLALALILGILAAPFVSFAQEEDDGKLS